MVKTRKYFNSFFPFFLIFVTGLFLVSPLLIPGFFPMHDDTQVARVYEMAKSLRDGMFPVRWVADLGYGYGYPIFNFYAPLAYYIGAFFVLLGLDPLLATKIMISLPIFVLGFGTYFLAKSFWGRPGGIISSILAMGAPYVALLLYVRGAISEYYALSFIPLVFYGMYGIFRTGKFRFVVLTALSIAGVILSHNLTAVIASPFLVSAVAVFTFFLLKTKRKSNILALIFAVILGILISAFYWLPALGEMHYTNVSSQVGGGADFRDHFVCPIQLWESQWGFGGSAQGCLDGMSYRIGKIHLLLAILAIPLIFLIKKKRNLSALVFGFCVFLLSIFMALFQSEPVWRSLSFLGYIQYPWRFLGMGSLSLSFIAGSLVLYTLHFKMKTNHALYTRIFLVIFIAIGTFVLYAKLFQPQFIGSKTSEDYTSISTIRFETSKISDEYLPVGFIKPKLPGDVPSADIEVLGDKKDIEVVSQKVKTQEKEFGIRAGGEGKILMNIAYFPAWKVYVDGEMTEYEVLDKKLVVPVTEGEHVLRAVYESTRLQGIANLASIVGIIIVVVGIIIASHKKIL